MKTHSKLLSLIIFTFVLFSVFGGAQFSPVANAAASPVFKAYEAEKATLSSKTMISKKASGYTGSGYVVFPAKKAGSSLTLKPVLSASATLQIEFRFANASKGSSVLSCFLNGKSSKLSFFRTFGASKCGTGWKTLVIKKAFKKGTNVLTLKRTTADTDAVSLDRIRLLGKVGPSATPTLSPLKAMFNGKKVLCMGDSITAFCGYPETMSDLTGATVYNAGAGGTRINGGDLSFYQLVTAITSANWSVTDPLATSSSANTKENYATLKTVNFTTLDYLVVAYGTNDFVLKDPIGTDTDLAPTQATFKGGYNKSLELLKAAYPNLKILLVTPMFRTTKVGNVIKTSDEYDWGTGHYLIEFVDAVIQVGAKNSVPVLDNYRNSGINEDTIASMTNDGTHPNYLGAEYIAKKVAYTLLAEYKTAG